MLGDVLLQFAADSGLHEVQKRPYILSIMNRAALEMHKQLECAKIYREATVLVQPNAVVTLPWDISDLRGMRAHTADYPFDLKSLGQPRYTDSTQSYKYKNWRDLGDSPIHTELNNVAPLKLVCNAIEDDPVTVSITGQTVNAQKITEQVLVNATLVTTTNLFGPEINAISCMTDDRTQNITILDTNNTEIAVLYNTARKSLYRVCDVSMFPWVVDGSDGSTLTDILFKVRAVRLQEDGDQFYAGDDYDEAWYNLCMFMELFPMQNRKADALAHKQVYENFMLTAKASEEADVVKKLNYSRNKFYGLYSRGRYGYGNWNGSYCWGPTP